MNQTSNLKVNSTKLYVGSTKLNLALQLFYISRLYVLRYIFDYFFLHVFNKHSEMKT